MRLQTLDSTRQTSKGYWHGDCETSRWYIGQGACSASSIGNWTHIESQGIVQLKYLSECHRHWCISCAKVMESGETITELSMGHWRQRMGRSPEALEPRRRWLSQGAVHWLLIGDGVDKEHVPQSCLVSLELHHFNSQIICSGSF